MNLFNPTPSYIKGFRPPHTPIILFLIALTAITEANKRKRKN